MHGNRRQRPSFGKMHRGRKERIPRDAVCVNAELDLTHQRRFRIDPPSL